MAAIIYCHKFGAFEQQEFILSQFWKPEVWNQHHGVEIKALEALERIPSWPQLASSDCWHFLACGRSSVSVFTLPFLICVSYLPLPLSYKDVCDCMWAHSYDLGSSPYLGTLNLITSANHIPFTLKHLQVLWIRSWHLWVPLFSPLQ